MNPAGPRRSGAPEPGRPRVPLPVRPRVLGWLLAVVLVVGCGAAAVLGGSSAASGVPAAGGWRWTAAPAPPAGAGPAGLLLGVTHTQASIDPTGDPAARDRAESVLRGLRAGGSGGLQNQSLMGWGTLSPEPSPGRYEWSTLDQRMSLIARTGGTAVLTAAGAPDWMKGGAAGATDWSTLDDAPLPEHYADFAALTAAAVARYPAIHYVQVWNELKGFYDDAANTWDAAAYTDFYNQVYDAVRAVRPDVRVGGPYVVLSSWQRPTAAAADPSVAGGWGAADRRSLEVVDYWLAHKHGADFIAVDASAQTRDGRNAPPDPAAATKFADLTTWLRARTDLPVWWSEFYPAQRPDAGPLDPSRVGRTIDIVARMAQAGAAAALLWRPEAEQRPDPSVPTPALWAATGGPDGGGPAPLAAPWAWLTAHLAAGGVAIGRTGDGSVLRLQAPDSALVVNLSSSARLVDGLRLAPFGTVVTPGPGPAAVPGPH